jgi:hypothetical protein
LRIPFSDGQDMDILPAAVPAVRAGNPGRREHRGIRMRRLLVGLVLAVLVLAVVAIGEAP